MTDKPAQGTRYQRAIRAFRSQLAVLKKKGLIAPDFNVRNARKTPENLKLVAKFQDVAEGRATTLKVKKSELKTFQKAGYRTAKGKVIVEKMPEQRIASRRGTSIAFRSRQGKGFSRILVNVKAEDLDDYLDRLETAANRWPEREGMSYGFRFFRNPSLRTYDRPEAAVKDLRGYQTVVKTVRDGTGTEQLEVIRNIEILMADNDFVHWGDLPRPKYAGGPNSGRRRPGGRKGSPRKPTTYRSVKRRTANPMGIMSKAAERAIKALRKADRKQRKQIGRAIKKSRVIKKSDRVVSTVSKKTAARIKSNNAKTSRELEKAKKQIEALKKQLTAMRKSKVASPNAKLAAARKPTRSKKRVTSKGKKN